MSDSYEQVAVSLDAAIASIQKAQQSLGGAIDSSSNSGIMPRMGALRDHIDGMIINAVKSFAGNLPKAALNINDLVRYNDYFRYDALQNMWGSEGIEQLNNYFNYESIKSNLPSNASIDFSNWVNNHPNLFKNLGRAGLAAEVITGINDLFNTDDPIAKLVEIAGSSLGSWGGGAAGIAAGTAIVAGIGIAGLPAIAGIAVVGMIGAVGGGVLGGEAGAYLGAQLEKIEWIDDFSTDIDGVLDSFEDSASNVLDDILASKPLKSISSLF